MIALLSRNDDSLPPDVTHLLRLLDGAQIKYQLWRHEPTPRVEDAHGVHRALPDGLHTKNLFLQAGKKGAFFLFTCEAERRVQLSVLANYLEVKRFSFGDEASLRERLQVRAGAVTPLALFHDKARAVQGMMSDGVRHARRVYVHPLVNDLTLGLKGEDLWQFVSLHHGAVRLLPDAAWMG